MICTSTVLAMRIEIALQPSINAHQHLASKGLIFTELQIIKEASENWSCLIWTIRMFEAVLTRTRLGLISSTPCEHDNRNRIDEVSNDTANIMTYSDETRCSNGLFDQETMLIYDDPATNLESTSQNGELNGVPPISENYDWLQSLLTPRPITDILDQFDDLS